jgi:HlyD family secretion protein
MQRLIRFAPVALLLALVGGVTLYFRSRPKVVEVVAPVRKTVVESIAAAGRVRGFIEVSVGAQTSGRLSEVNVRDGSLVKAGDIIARVDDAVLQAQARQARVAVATAEAQLAQANRAIRTAQSQLAVASRPPLSSDVAKLRADIAQNIAVAEAKRAGAKQRLTELQTGATREERLQIEAQVSQAKANLEQAQREYLRQSALVKEGAVAQQLLDNAETTRKVTQRNLDNLTARYQQTKIGTRPEQIAQATADLKAADATVAGAKASGEAALRSLFSTPRPEDVQVARDRVTEAQEAQSVAAARLAEVREALEVGQKRLDDVLVKAPWDGTVTQVVTEAGGVTGPNQPIVRLVRTGRPEIRIDVDEINLGKIRAGQSALVTSDAFPEQKFEAKIREIGSQVDADRGTVEVRLDPQNPPEWLRPGQTVSVNIIVDKGTERLIVPLTAITTVGGNSSALIVDNGVIVKRDLKVGPPGSDGVPVRDGLRETDTVIVNPTGLIAGQSVAPKPMEKGKKAP